MPKLNNIKREMFCNEFIVDLNATQAYMRVYVGSEPSSARSAASLLLTKDNIKRRISELMQKRSKRVRCTADDVLKELMKVAFSNITDFASWDDETFKLIPSKMIKKSKIGAISEINIDKTVKKVNFDSNFDEELGEEVDYSKTEESILKTKVKLYDKLRALDMIGKHLKMWKDIDEEGNDENESYEDFINSLDCEANDE